MVRLDHLKGLSRVNVSMILCFLGELMGLTVLCTFSAGVPTSIEKYLDLGSI